MIKKGQLKLISSGKVKKKFKKCSVYLCNDSLAGFNLEEWDVYKDNDWIEFNKKDGTEMRCFYVSNILSIYFEYTTEEVKKTDNVSGGLKPVA